MAIVYELRAGDAIAIDGGRVLITLREKFGNRAKVAVDCDGGVRVQRIQRARTAAEVVQAVGVGTKGVNSGNSR